MTSRPELLIDLLHSGRNLINKDFLKLHLITHKMTQVSPLAVGELYPVTAMLTTFNTLYQLQILLCKYQVAFFLSSYL